MRPRTKKFGKRFLSLFLSLAICATLLPTVALAEDAELIKFKNMHMTVLRNGTTVANYDYSSKNNDFEHDIAFALNDTWVKLDYVISYSQYVSLKLYKMADGQDWQTGNPLKLESYIDPDSPPNYGADVDEEFLGDFIGYLNGVRVTDNVTPVDESADFVGYQRIDDDDWNEIVWDAIDRDDGDRSGCTTAENIYAFGFEGESYAHYKQEKDDALNQAADHPAALPDAGPAEEPVSSEAPNPAEDVDDAAPSDEIEDTEGEAAAEPTSENSDILGTESADAETPDSENDDTDVAEADDTAAVLNQEDVSEEADHSDETAAPADDVIAQPEESEGTDAQASEDTQEETPAESIPEETDESVDEAPEDASTEEPAAQPENYVELEDESAVLLGDTAFFSDRDAADGETIQNIFLWDGYVENGGKVFKPDYEPGRYVIVMQPVNPATAPYNSFLAFEVVDSEDISDTFQNINSYEDFLEIVNELACPAEPVDLLTGSFKWEYTDFSLYGDHDLPFTRYYESKDAAFEHGFGRGWSTDYTAELEFHDLYTTAILPKGVRLNFTLDFDGSYYAAGDYSLSETADGYVLYNSKAGKIWSFNAAGKLTSIEKTDGNTINCTYSGGKLTEISGDAGSFTLSYSGDHVTKVTDSTGRSIDLTYDGDNLISVRNPDADSLRFSYDANGYLASVENFEGQVYVENTYDESGHVIHQYAANIGTFDFSYDFDARHNICTGTDGYLCEIWYDELGRITASKDASGTQHVTYNELNQVTSRTDREGNTTEFEYDAAGNKSKITYADGTYERFEYDSNRQVTWMRDRNGNESFYTYDDHTHMTSSTDGRGNTTRYTYDSDGNMTSVTNALNETISYTYDANGNCTAMTDALGNTTRYVYDEQGRLVSATDANGGVTRYEYTTAGKLVKITDADGNVQTYEVNGNGFNTVESDWMGNLTRYTYDTQSNVTSVTDPLGNQTLYTYDDRGNLSTTTDANGHTTSYTYDASGRMISMTDANGNVWTYSYNNESQMTSVTDPTGGKVTTSYDEVGRTTSTKDANGNTTRYTYGQ